MAGYDEDEPQTAKTVHESEKPSLLDQHGRKITLHRPIGFRLGAGIKTKAGPKAE